MHAARALARAVLLLTALSARHSVSYGQGPKTPPAFPASESASEGKAGDQAAAPDSGFWERKYLTGDWGGTRSQAETNGLELEFSLTQFVQGIADGGIKTGAAGTGKFQTSFKFDLGKLAGWKFWSAEVKTETRFGGPLLLGTGAINPVNTAVIVPGAAGSVFSITSLNITRLFPIHLEKGDLIAVSVGRYNLLDLVDEEFFAGRGIDRFFNMAQIGPLTVLREVPLITNGASFAYVRRGEPFFTFALLDPNDHSLDPGLSDLFTDGVTFSPGINLPSKFFGKTGKHSFSAAVTTKKYTPFDSIRQIILPGPSIHPIQPESGSWSVSYTFRQYIVERGRKDGWGLFGQVAFSDRNTSPITKFVNVGVGGSGLFKGRLKDEFGIAYAYTDLSEVLKDNLAPLSIRRLQAEHQGEMFYNFHITPWLRLTADLQILRPARPIADIATVPGVRLSVIF